MYGLLIVDDEYQARSGLRDLIDWKRMGIYVLGDAEDGDEALPMISSLRPDILLTDVRMNRMDGLELAREAKKLSPALEIVFISGYSDSEYLHQALKVGAYDYIYKPIRVSEVARVMEKLTSRLSAAANARREMERAKALLEKSRPLLRERFLLSWLDGALTDPEEIRGRMEMLDYAFPEGSGLAVALFQPDWASLPGAEKAQAYLMLAESEARKQIAESLCCVDETGVALLSPVARAEDMQAFAERLDGVSKAMRAYADAELLAGVSAWHADWALVPDALKEAQIALDRRFFDSGASALAYEADGAPPEPFGAEMLSRLLASGDEEAVLSQLERALGARTDAEFARERMMAFALAADMALREKGAEGIGAMEFCRRAASHMPVPALRRVLESLLTGACAGVRSLREGKYSEAVERVARIIREEYASRLTLESIAEKTHYSPAHLSTLFKQETGSTIGEVLSKTRLLAAMALLSDTGEPVYLVAQKAGYPDAQYFSKLFKRVTGATPLEYRKKALK